MSHSTFALFGTSHILTLVIFTTVTVVLLHTLVDASHRTRHRALVCLRWTVTASIVVWRGLAALTHQFDIGKDLPIAICSMSTIMLAVYLWRPKRWLFDILSYWTLVGSSLALLLPDLREPFPSIRFFDMFASHGVNLVAILYLVVVRGDSPSEGSYRLAFWAFAAYGLGFALPVDELLHRNYLFLMSPPALDFPPVHLLPAWPWYWLVFLGFFYGAFRIVHAAFSHHTGPSPESRERYAH